MLTEGQTWLQELLALPGDEQPTAWRAKCLFCAAELARSRGDHHAAQAHATEALAMWRHGAFGKCLRGWEPDGTNQGLAVRTGLEFASARFRDGHGQIEPPGKLDEFDNLWHTFWSAPGALAAFMGTAVYWGVDRAANTTVSISVWAEHPDEIPAYNELVRKFSPRALTYLTGQATVDTFEVVQHM